MISQITSRFTPTGDYEYRTTSFIGTVIRDSTGVVPAIESVSVAHTDYHILASGYDVYGNQRVTWSPDEIRVNVSGIARENDNFGNGIILEVRFRNEAPVAGADAISLNQLQSVVFNPLSNDYDPNGSALRYVGISQGAHGQVRIRNGANGVLEYTRTDRYVGSDTFTSSILGRAAGDLIRQNIGSLWITTCGWRTRRLTARG